MALSSGEWRKSSYSGDKEFACVEARALRAARRGVQVRDTKDRGRGVLAFDARAWTAFVGRIRGEAVEG
ncbi:DUF397 domain-containing protein (plasmid) [Streptomyces albidoflavus]|uniref:DUF397 domain-containing protein n=1 Tax=Streptomyces albidoflavus TaxID=1886 RepID=A0A8G1ZK80_9ACTN|nr:DUF397 domain-containing protein [Streptomyces albidoflavus]RZE15449.1 DUF397 domain-containing protein [Streptomyces albidoflavus]WSU19565.1 DUF397 domain-containing protein [Streptomyces albidoflavus]CAI4198535.1 DUF397 domain-containing protein [Streptomyces albidoflavus]